MGIVQCLPLYYFTEHPIMLRNTAGEKGEYPQNSERVKSCSKRHFHPFLSVYLIKSKQGRKRNTSQPLPPPCVPVREYRGSAHRARRLKARHKPTDEILFPAPPSLRDTSPIWLMPHPVRLRGTAMEEVNSELSSPKAGHAQPNRKRFSS